MKMLYLTLVILLALTIVSTSCTSTSKVPKVAYINVNLWGDLVVALVPTDAVQAGKYYKVDLYEKDKLRATSTVSWSEVELNVKMTKGAIFHLTDEEVYAYRTLPLQKPKDLSRIFSAKVHE